MPSETSQKRVTKQSQGGGAAPQAEPEHLPCPRCDSTNTKFCYYNNYNFSQPRHFCKSCRRYWTHGGTLRDIPVGGGSRKNAKRSRISSGPVSVTGTASTASVHDYRHISAAASPFLGSFAVEHGGSVSPFMGDVKAGFNMCGSFTSFLNSQGSTGLLALGGFGLGVEDMGIGLGRSVWPFPGVGIGLSDGGSATRDSEGSVLNTWQLESGQGGFVG